MTHPYNPIPLLEILTDEDPLQLAWMLDEQVQILIGYAEHERIAYSDISTQVHLLRLLRDGFLKSAGKGWK